MIAGLTIRQAVATDATAIAHLIAPSIPDFLAHADGRDATAFLAGLGEEGLAACIGHPGFRYSVACIDGTLVAAVAVQHPDHLYHLFVDAAHQRQGIATHLWWHARAQLLDDPQILQITVNASVPAVTFYQRLGFLVCGAIRTHHGVRFQPMEWPVPRA